MTKRVAWFTGEPSVKACFTPYKVYEVVREENTNFSVINDKGIQNFCLKKGCAHICHKDWVLADVVEEDVKVETIVKSKKVKKWSEWRRHTTWNVPKELDKNDIVKVKLRNLPKGVPFTVGTGCWVECGDYTIMEYKVKLKEESKWTKNTGVMPVDVGVKVEVKLRGGIKEISQADDFYWSFEDEPTDIIKWRLAE